MLDAATAWWKVRESPTEIGSTGICGPMPPASKMISRPGAWVRCASIAAIIGRPVPTNTDLRSSSSRAATQARSSVAE